MLHPDAAVVIVAGGSGTRMGAGIPKQFMPVQEKPVLMHTLEKFSGVVGELVVVLPELHMNFWKQLCDQHDFSLPHTVVAGGVNRTESVYRGLKACGQLKWVAIHDAVRPLVSKELIDRLINAAKIYGNAVPAVPPRESMRVLDAVGNRAVNRDEFRLVQTPQCFDYKFIMEHFESRKSNEYTDDASLAESLGEKIHLEPGEFTNIKITFPEDLIFASQLLAVSGDK